MKIQMFLDTDTPNDRTIFAQMGILTINAYNKNPAPEKTSDASPVGADAKPVAKRASKKAEPDVVKDSTDTAQLSALPLLEKGPAPAPAVDDISFNTAFVQWAKQPTVGLEKAQEKLAAFGVKRAKDIPADQRAKFLAEIAQ